MGRDLAFSPTGDQVALFVKKERGRNLMLMNPISGRSNARSRWTSSSRSTPRFRRTARQVAFGGIVGNQADIFVYDLDNGSVAQRDQRHVLRRAHRSFRRTASGLSIRRSSTATRSYSGSNRAPIPRERYQLTTGDVERHRRLVRPDGKRLFFASDTQTGRNVVAAAQIVEVGGGPGAERTRHRKSTPRITPPTTSTR